jgi:hypothetical protein
MAESLSVAQTSAERPKRAAGDGSGNPTRRATMAGDIAVSLMWLCQLAEDVGVRDDIKALLLGNEMIDNIFSLIGEGHIESRNANPH